MVRVRTSLTIFGLLSTLIACSRQPIVSISIETPTPAVSVAASATPFVAETEAVLPSPTPWVGGTETALAVSSAEAQNQNFLPTAAPAVMEKPTDFSPVLYGGKLYQSTFFLLLGGVNRETWLAPDMSIARFSGEVTYSLHSLTQEAKYFVWGKTPEFSPTCKVYSVGTDAMLDEAGFVGVVDG
jgi:hypothetical protein